MTQTTQMASMPQTTKPQATASTVLCCMPLLITSPVAVPLTVVVTGASVVATSFIFATATSFAFATACGPGVVVGSLLTESAIRPPTPAASEAAATTGGTILFQGAAVVPDSGSTAGGIPKLTPACRGGATAAATSAEALTAKAASKKIEHRMAQRKCA